MSSMDRQLQETFIGLYGASERPLRIFHAPGRVNLIGEHIDYNGGYVLPAALTVGTTLLIREREDNRFAVASVHFEGKKTIARDQLAYADEDDWMNYPKGVIVTMEEMGLSVGKGYDFLFHGTIPNGAGLSSSASIEVVTAYALHLLEGHPIDRSKLALLAQRAENRYIGVNCGIMDQFAVANGSTGQAIMLNCDTLEFRHIPIELGDYVLIIANTNKRRGLVDSEYNNRRSECEQALTVVQRSYPEVEHLAELTPRQLGQIETKFDSEIVWKRAKHVVEENDRVLKSVAFMESGDLAAFGQLLNASHASLRDLFEVSCFELDVMVEEAQKLEGVLGSRMTGAGFGGCTVSLVHKDSVKAFQTAVGEKYKERTGYEAEFYLSGIGDGVAEKGV